MKAQKIKVKITIQALSVDSVPAILSQVAEQLNNEVDNGKFHMDDGDVAKWKITRKEVKF